MGKLITYLKVLDMLMSLRDNALERLRRLRVENDQEQTYCKHRRREQQKAFSLHFDHIITTLNF